MKNLNNASLPLNFSGGKYSTESVKLPDGQYIIKIVATGPCIGKILKGSEVLAEVDFSSYKLLSYNDLKILFILSSESEISLEVTPKREDVKVYSASLSSSILPVGGDEYPTPTGTINITENGENIDVKQYAKANVNVPAPTLPPVLSVTVTNPQGDNITVSPVYDGLGKGMPIGQDIYAGASDSYKYNYKIVTTGEIDLSKLKLRVYKNDVQIASFPFTAASVQTFVKNNVKYSVIDYSTATVNNSCNTISITYDNVKYLEWVAVELR